MEQWGKLVRDGSKELLLQWGRSTDRAGLQDTEGRLGTLQGIPWGSGAQAEAREHHAFLTPTGRRVINRWADLPETEGNKYHWVPDSLMGPYQVSSLTATYSIPTLTPDAHKPEPSLHLSAHLCHLLASHPRPQRCPAPLINGSHTLGCSQECRVLTLHALSRSDTHALPSPALPAPQHGLTYTCLPSTCPDTTGTGMVESKPRV